MALVLVEGEEKLPVILAAADVDTTSKGPQSSSPAKSDASGWVIKYVHRHAFVIAIATVLTSLF